MNGYKHLVECNCVLPQYRSHPTPVFHKFVVFSVLDESGSVIPKNVQCENCGTIHKIYDICKSEIVPGKDESRSVLTKKDVSASLTQSLIDLLEEYQLGIADYEAAKFYIDNEMWGSVIILSKEIDGDGYSGKMLNFVGHGKFRVDPYFGKDMI
jgi:hypothetical protein